MRCAGRKHGLRQELFLVLGCVVLVSASCSSTEGAVKKSAEHVAANHSEATHRSTSPHLTKPSTIPPGQASAQNPTGSGAPSNSGQQISPATPNTFLTAQDFQSIQQAVQSFSTTARSTNLTNFALLPAALSSLVDAVQTLQNSINTEVSDTNYRSSLVDQGNVLYGAVTNGGELLPAGVSNLTMDYQKYLACTSSNDPSFCADQSQNDMNEILMGLDEVNRSISSIQSTNDSLQRTDQWWVACTQTQPQQVCLNQVNPNG